MHAEIVERLYLFNWSNSSHLFNSCQPAHILFGSIDASYSRAELPLKVFFYFSTETAMSSVSSAYLMLSAFCSQIFTPGRSSKSRRTVSLHKLNTFSEKRIPVMLLFCFCVLFKFVLDVNFRSLFPGKIVKKTQVLTTTVKLQKRVKKFPRCKQLKNFFYEVFLFFFCHIYPPFTRKRIVSLYFGRDVRIRLGVTISELSGPPVFHIKVEASREKPCPRTRQANLPACSPQPPLNAERQAGKLWIPFFKAFWYD